MNATKPVSLQVEDIRSEMARLRSKISDIYYAHKSWKEHLEASVGLLTCGISSLANTREYIAKCEVKWDDQKHGKHLAFRSRGIGLDSCPGCFVCGRETRTDDPSKSAYLNNIAAFVSSKEDGEEIVRWFNGLARLDFRPSEPSWIQLKVGACDAHLPELKALEAKTSVHGVIRCADITSISTPPQLA